MGVNTAKTAAQVVKTANKVKDASAIGANSAKVATTVGQKSQKLLGFTPQILDGNKKFGLKHILKRHSFESTAEGVSRFLPGFGKKEITSLASEAIGRVKGWKIAENGFHTAIVDMGKIVGYNLKGKPTTQLQIALKDNSLRTMYPF